MSNADKYARAYERLNKYMADNGDPEEQSMGSEWKVKYTKCDDVYLYRIFCGRIFMEVLGTFYLKRMYKDCTDEVWTQSAWISVLEKNMRHETRYQCSPEPGVVYNKCVWFHEPNRKKAAELLIEYEESEIVSLSKKINAHKEIIDILKKEI